MEEDPDAPGRLKGFLVSGTSWAFVGMAGTLVFTFAVNAIAARLLEPAAFGTFVLLISVAQGLAVVAELGLPPLVTRELARSPSAAASGARWLTASVGLVAGASVALGLLAWGLGPWLADTVLTDVQGLAAVAGLLGFMVAGRAFERLLPDAFRGLRDIRQATVFGPVWTQAVAALGLVALWLVRDGAVLSEAVLVYGLAGISGGVVAAWRLRRVAAPFSVVDAALTRRMLAESWPVMGHRGMYAVVQQADLWIVGALLASQDTALYGASLRLVGVISVPLLVVNQVVPPLIASMSTTGRTDRLERALRVTATVAGIPGFVILLAFVVAGGPILALVFGPFYRQGAAILAVLSLGQMFNVWAGSCGVALMQSGQQRVLLGISALSGLLLVVGATLAAPTIGTLGVAAVAAAALGLQNLLMVRAVRGRLGVNTTVDVRSIGPAVTEGLAIIRESLSGASGRGRGR